MMERRKFLGALTGTSLGVLFKGSFSELAQAQNTSEAAADSHGSARNQFPPNSTIILVHAAWADGSCWSKVILPLQDHGFQVICAPLPLTSLTNDATALSQVLERTSGPVVLVGHAYSGAVIAAVREDRVKSLVYVTALAPDEGETVAKVFYLNPNSPEAPTMAPDSHGFVWLPDDAFPRAITHKATRDESKIAAALQRPLGVPCIQQPAPAPLWKSKPSWFLVAEEDRMINPKTQRFMANRMGAKIRSSPVDHSPMISDPQVVIDVILEAARQTLLS
ncbi:pimeloyl-ACP methyl ester carboxylesterase [Silvibacterium bohemicum]|uniref:Pimeloyl-ACP methyl ester carboxylesterase n=1 Tax=Silvibacterium bohemicum TaxID=1577686 RepID=A0A841JYZ0_9BACT|nr:alpha/beta hydrolase [Silvibacterium bohemicum]MBB6143194.1 pimeloyl-ACP methyl ester carboxylesterase [Silvibacterium bohemicum]